MNIALFRFVNDTLKSGWLDSIMPAFADKDYVVIPVLMAAVALAFYGGRRARILLAALAAAIVVSNLGSEQVIKNLFKEDRPYASIENVHLFRNGEWTEYDPGWYPLDKRKSFSFPSSHASNAAAATTVLALFAPMTLCVTVPMAALAGLSRIYTGNHYPLDVLGGYVWGICAGLAMTWLVRKLARRFFAPAGPTLAQPIPRERVWFYWLLGGWTVFNFAYLLLNLYDLSGDESLYWDMSRNLDLGYYSKPPMIAYVINFLTHAGGSRTWAIRSGAIFFSSGALALLHALTLRISKSERAAFIAVLVSIAMPSTWVGSVILTIDPVLIFFWLLAMYAFHRATAGERAMWVLTGFALGFGMLTKYTMLLLYVSFALYLLFFDRRWWRTPWPYVALGIALACSSGVIYWNAQNDWISVRHTASIGVQQKKNIGKMLGNFFEYSGGQIGGVVSPVIFGFFAWAMTVCGNRFRRNRDAAYLFLCFAVLFGFYIGVAFTRKANLNWPICAYSACAIALGWLWTESDRPHWARRGLLAALIVGCAAGFVTRFSDIVYYLPMESLAERWANADPNGKQRGGREIGEALSKYITAPDTGPFPFSNRYQISAWSAFYTKNHPRAYWINVGDDRLNQYYLWGGWSDLKGRDGLFVTGGDAAKAQLWIEGMVQFGAFERGEVLEVVEVSRGDTLIDRYSISRMYNCAGIENEQATEKY